MRFELEPYHRNVPDRDRGNSIPPPASHDRVNSSLIRIHRNG